MAAQNLNEMTVENHAETTTNGNETSPDEAQKPVSFTLLNFLCPPKIQTEEEQEDEEKQEDTKKQKKKKIKFITGSDGKNAYTGFRKFRFENKLRELPWHGAFKILYKTGLFIFFSSISGIQ